MLLAALALEPSQPDPARSQALDALDRLNDPRRLDTAARALILPGPRSRTAALRVLAKADPAAAIAPVEDRLKNGSSLEQQGAIAILAAMPEKAARRLLLDWLDRLIAGKVAPEIQLDLVEAAARRTETEFREKIKKYESTKRPDDPLAAFREVLAGGDKERGRQLFTSKAEIECVRCHKVRGPNGESAGGEVGPELSGVGARLSRADLLESIVNPNKQIAQGFESVVIATSDGKVQTGIFKGEDAREVRLMTAEGKSIAIAKDTIEERKRGPSAMPADVAAKLTRRELRDLIEFLASQKAAPGSSQAAGK